MDVAKQLAGLASDAMLGEILGRLLEAPGFDSLTADEISSLKEKFQVRAYRLRDESERAYREHFTEDELTAIWDWNISPVGQKLRELIPVITVASYEVGQKIAEEIIIEIAKEATPGTFGSN